MNSKYPSPCLKCNRADTCKGYYGNAKYRVWCKDYEVWFKWLWKYFRKALGVEVKPKIDPERKPCERCSADGICDKACLAYLKWYDARMQIVRKNFTERIKNDG